ncbi:hypothetical protein [Streptococcus suis]|uniref:hypothetical protein n=1 Tax=Streptococcus suis TaxID=1307 RepID=UPI000CF5A026|nr:hypothetical protein [Streptococcus suis]HEM3599752.1 hypothetical protein [Streptococcus suis]HEM3603876.1 hypothetical protein [Streptococcus suis]HEM3605784.1 hypothetical protein [Streptococcus suis]
MIRDKNFLEFEYMPPFQKKEDMAGWLAKNEPMRYVWDKARRVLVFNPDTKTWQGINYGKSERVLLSNHKGISRRNKKIFETAEKCKLDLMTPATGKMSYISNWDEFQHEEVIYKVASYKDFMYLFILWAIRDGYIVRDSTGYFVGRHYR